MSKFYYSKNSNNIFSDKNLEKIPKKRKNDSCINKYIKFLEDILNNKENNLSKNTDNDKKIGCDFIW